MKCLNCGAENPEESLFCVNCGKSMYNSGNEKKRQLVRTRNNTRIAGVCGGLAQYFEIDPTMVRVIFLVLLLTGSLGFWIYLIIWFLAPWDNQA